MKFVALIIVVIAAMSQAQAVDEAIADYGNSALHRAKEGRRIGDIFNENKIEWTALGSAGMSVFVDSKDAARARYLLAKLVLKENLDISLIGSLKNNDRYDLLDPKEVVNDYEKRKASAASP